MAGRNSRVRWTESARRDLNEIAAFLAQQSPNRALRVVKRIRTRARSLEHQPERGRIVPELGNLGIHSWRELVEAPYRVVYRVADPDVRVVLVVDGRRDLSTILLERLLRNE